MAGCGGDAGNDLNNLRPAKGGRNYGGTFRMNEVQELRVLDPVGLNDAPSHHAVHQIAELLVDIRPDSINVLQPELAERWEVSPDGLTYTYHLRRGVKFQDDACFPEGKGRLMTATDVKYCFDRSLDARAGTVGIGYFRDKVKGAQDYFEATRSNGKTPIPTGGVAGFRAVDDSTFVIDLLKPFAAFKYYPALGCCYIYPREAVEHYGKDFPRHLVGTGPFVFDHWSSGQELVMKRNPNYWRRDSHGNQLPFLDAVSFTFIKDEKQQLAEVASGNLEEAYRIPSELFPQVVDANGKGKGDYAKFTIHRVEALSTQFYGMLCTSPEFKDRRVRQAFNYAIDRDQIVRYTLQGQAAGAATHGLVPPSMPGYDSKGVRGYSYNLDTARALMAAAGYPGGKGFPAVSIQLNNGGGRNLLVAQAMQQMLSKLGVNVGLKQLEWPQHQEALENGRAPLYRLGWVADYPDPENFLNLFNSRTIPASGPSQINSARYANPAFDSLLTLAIGTLDDAERMRLYQQAEQVAVDDAPMIFIYNDMDFRVVQPYVQNYFSNSMDRRDLTEVWFASTTGEKNG